MLRFELAQGVAFANCVHREPLFLRTLREKLVKSSARIVRQGRYLVFQLAEVAVPRALLAEILRRIDELRPRPSPLSA